MADVFVYALCEPDTGAVRYIGITTSPKTRLQGHISECKRAKLSALPKVVWLRQVLASGQVPTLHVLQQCTAEDWAQAERRWIQHFREAGAQLTNVAPGGWGHSPASDGHTRAFRGPATAKRGILLPHLTAWRESQLLSTLELSKLSNVGWSPIKRAEQGAPIQLSNARKLAQALGISPHQLLSAPESTRGA